MSKVIKDTRASGRESMDTILSECLNAANEMTRHGGFAPAQWVLSRLPRSLATMGDEDECLEVSALQAHAYGPTIFGVQLRYRAKAREAFVRWGRVRRATVRKAPLVIGSYQVGDIVSYCTKARAGERGLHWSVGSRLIGSEKNKHSLGETQPRTCWIICDSVTVCVAIDRPRPCTPAEQLAFHNTQTTLAAESMNALHITTRQLLIHCELPMKTWMKIIVMTKMSEPTQMTSAEKRKADETAKELLASLPKVASSIAT